MSRDEGTTVPIRTKDYRRSHYLREGSKADLNSALDTRESSLPRHTDRRRDPRAAVGGLRWMSEMETLVQNADPTQKEKIVESVRPVIHDFNHQDSLFANSFSAKSHFIVHPEWNSEGVNPPASKPLDRAPWAWEQPRYRQNVQYPTTYETPVYNEGSNAQYQPRVADGYGVQDMGVETLQSYPQLTELENAKPECFRTNGEETSTLPYQHQTTMEERARLQWHLHY
ncbi:uncharacterized protein LOC124111422 [Haliotis rufescens]|uniref:uncharacterized protein LOC124111422 n=1 Tax=Haliotis rufescens TaxID=6454 RepID=UPI001EB08955|nr:uncharacterized protein LOC124111422 [Haliotis rufescens]